MLKLRRAVPEDRQAIMELWQAEFGDEAGFIDDFCAWCGWEQIFLLFEDGAPRSMIAAPLVDVTLPGGGAARAGYLYALTTLGESRGNGFGRMLLNYADFCLQNQKADCAVLVPAEESLFSFFARSGFAQAFALREELLDGEELSEFETKGVLRAATPEEYRAVQEKLLAGTPHVVSPVGLLGQQKKLCAASGAELYVLELNHGHGCAAAERQEDGSVLLRELLTPAEDREQALAALHTALKAERYTVRSPLEGAEKCAKPFGVVKWYDTEKAKAWNGLSCGYLGLALD